MILIAVVLFTLAVMVLLGKGDKMIAGYNTASEEERKKVNLKNLRIVVAVILVLGGVYCNILISPMLATVQSKILATVVFMVVVTALVVLGNIFWFKKKEE